MNEHEQWLNSITRNASHHEVSRRTGIDNSGLSKKFRGNGRLTAEQVIKISHAYGVDPVQALRDTGHLPQLPQEETPEQLAARIKADVDRLASKIQESNVIPLRPNQDSDVHQAPYSDEQLGSVAYGEQDIDPKEDDDHIP